jgi:hypothetical protein
MLVTLNPVRPYAFLLRLAGSVVAFRWPAVSKFCFNAAKISTTWPVRRGAGFDFLAFHFFLDHGERTLAVSLAGPSTSMLQGQNRRYTMKPINKKQAKR